MKAAWVMTTVDYQGAHWERLRQAVAPGQISRVDRQDDTAVRAALREAEVAIIAGDLDARYLDAPGLAWVHCDHAGLDRFARSEIFAKGLVVTTSAGRSSPALAEHAIFFMLALSYRFALLYEAQQAHRWGIPGQEDLRGLYGKTIGIVGMGHTGQELARRARSLGMRVLGFRRSIAPVPEGVHRVYAQAAGESIDALLEQSDFVVLALPLSDRTHRLLGARELRRMKPSAFLINIARGAIVDEGALLEALREGRIAGAGLDTFRTEPLPADDPLWDAPNTLITPHFTPQVPDRTGRSLDIICENLRRYRSGEPLLNQLTPEDVYTVPGRNPA
jgi:phosphoglycerate dehydrogenase-like enzyme